MKVSEDILSHIFSDASLICGREDVIHAVIYHHLVRSGIDSQRISREQRLSKGPIDIALFKENFNGNFSTTTDIPEVVIEVKGGAYGNRNALLQEIDAGGYCKDMDKLRLEAEKGVECWFLCVDMAELGRAVMSPKLQLISERCSSLGICFAYYCQGDSIFHLSTPRNNLTQVPLVKKVAREPRRADGFILERGSLKLDAFAAACLSVSGHEANCTARFYHCLRNAGYRTEQISLETYFSFAARPGQKMQQRPDLVIFNDKFDGRFNLYKNGNRKHSNDAHKLSHIDAIFEIKGGASMNKKSDKEVMSAYIGDIQKLALWRKNAALSYSDTMMNSIFLGVDGRPRGFSESQLSELHCKSRALGSNVLYISRQRLEILAV